MRSRSFTSSLCTKSICGLTMLFSSTSLVFGRDVIPILHGALGIIFSLEGYYGIHKRSPNIIKNFSIALLAYSVLRSAPPGLAAPSRAHKPATSVGLGALMVSEDYRQSQCQDSENFGTCSDTFIVFGAISVVSAVIWIMFAWIVYVFYRVLAIQEANIMLIAMESARYRVGR